MATTKQSEKERLFPVISTILALTTDERTAIKTALEESEEAKNGTILFTNALSLNNWFGFGSGSHNS